MMKRSFCLLLCVLLVVLALVSCGHTHTFSDEWKSDATNHWHEATCEGHSENKTSLAAHKDTDGNGACDVCGYGDAHVHTYAPAWVTDAENHWHAATCQHTDAKILVGAHADGDEDGACDICGYGDAHVHTYAPAWVTNATNHWHAATCSHSDVKLLDGAHADSNTDGLCDVCNYVISYTVDVDAPANVTVNGTLTAAPGADVTFTASVSDRYVLKAEGAALVGTPTTANGVITYEYKVEDLASNVSVEIDSDMVVFYEVIVDEAYDALPGGSAYQTVTKNLTFNAPVAGKYLIYDLNYSGVTFSYNGGYDASPMMFEVEEAGEVTVAANYFLWENTTEEKEFGYRIVLNDSDKFSIDSLSGGKVYLPTGADMEISINLPVDGKFAISETSEDLWLGSDGNRQVFEIADGNTVTLNLNNSNTDNAGFEFDYSISVISSPNAVYDGAVVTVPVDGEQAIVFTADEAATYMFSGATEGTKFGTWGDYGISYDWSGTYVVELGYGESIILYVDVANPYTGDETVDETLNINNLGTVVDNIQPDIEEGSSEIYYPDTVVTGHYEDEYGYYALATFINQGAAGYYRIYTAADGKVALVPGDGEELVWVDSLDVVYLDEGEAITFYVANTFAYMEDDDYYYDGIVGVRVEKIVYEVDLSMGENTITVTPGVDYTVNVLADLEYYAPYVLTWTDTSVSVQVNGMPCTSGEEFTWYGTWNSEILLSAEGDEEVTFTITLSDPSATGSELIIGNNAVVVTVENNWAADVELSFNQAGTYVLSAADGEENAVVGIINNGYEEVTLPYEFTVEEGDSVTFAISHAFTGIPTDGEYTVDLVVTLKDDDAAKAALLNGEYEALFYDMKMAELTFTPAAVGASYGTLAIEDTNSGAYTGTYYYALNGVGGVAVWNEDYSAANDITIAFNGDVITYQPKNFMNPMDLTVPAAGEESGSAAEALYKTWSDGTYFLTFYDDGTAIFADSITPNTATVGVQFNWTVADTADGFGDYAITASNAQVMVGVTTLFDNPATFIINGDFDMVVIVDGTSFDTYEFSEYMGGL